MPRIKHLFNQATKATETKTTACSIIFCFAKELKEVTELMVTTRSEEIDPIVAEEGKWIKKSLLEFGSFARDKSGSQNNSHSFHKIK